MFQKIFNEPHNIGIRRFNNIFIGFINARACNYTCDTVETAGVGYDNLFFIYRY